MSLSALSVLYGWIALTGVTRIAYRLQTQTAAEPNANWGIWLLVIIVLIVTLWWLLQREGQPGSTQSNVVVVSPPATPKEPVRGAATSTTPVAAPDDLTKIEGIGPKIRSVFYAAGINTFADLAKADVGHLRQVLAGAGLRVNDPTTWPEQAALAATGKWTELQRLQEQLDAGRRA